MTFTARALANLWDIPIYVDRWLDYRVESFEAPSAMVVENLRAALRADNHQLQHLKKAAKLLIGLNCLVERYQINPTAFQCILGGRRITQRLRSDSMMNEIEDAVEQGEGPTLGTLVAANRHMLHARGYCLITAELIDVLKLLNDRGLFCDEELSQIATVL